MKKTFCVWGIVFGIIIVVFGIFVMMQNPGSNNMVSTSFGADFYTYSYKATHEAAENIYYLSHIVRIGISLLLISIGITDICAFGVAMSNDSNKQVIIEKETKEMNDGALPPL